MVLTWPMMLQRGSLSARKENEGQRPAVLLYHTHSDSHRRRDRHRKQWLASSSPSDSSVDPRVACREYRSHRAQATSPPFSFAWAGTSSCLRPAGNNDWVKRIFMEERSLGGVPHYLFWSAVGESGTRHPVQRLVLLPMTRPCDRGIQSRCGKTWGSF